MSENSGGQKPIRIEYKFEFPDGTIRDFDVELEAGSLDLKFENPLSLPSWTDLEFNKCVNCPLTSSSHCPVAVRLSVLVHTFEKDSSHAPVKVRVKTEQRTYEQNTTVQRGLSSIMGILMVTSGCPVMDKLRPNTAFHLPFASPAETAYRTIGMYLIAQALKARNGGIPDWELKGLVEIYQQVALVNKGMARRLLAASKSDASTNAIVILHSFGEEVQAQVEEHLKELKRYFRKLA